MIRAQKRGPSAWMWARYVDRKLARTFRAVWLRGEPPEDDAPCLVYANHASFWDGFALHALGRALGRDAYCMMEEANLARWPFLAKLGAFSVTPGDPASALSTLRYARELLRRPRAMVGIFPEGVLQPGAAPPLELRRGVEVLARAARARCVPLAIRCAFLEHEKPDLLLELGAPHGPAPLEEFAERLGARLRALQSARSIEGFCPLVRGSRGAAERWRR